MGHARAVLGMVAVTLLWSVAGVVSRSLEMAGRFEVAFFRSFFALLALGLALTWTRGPAVWWRLRRARREVWLSGLCWGVMFTAFMVALTMTSVANVLVTSATSPLLTALCARVFLDHRLSRRTWAAILVAGAGIAWMFGRSMQASDARSLLGMVIACAVPVTTALNYTMLHHIGRLACEPDVATPGEAPDMPAAVLIGAALSAAAALPLAWPFQASAHDVALLAGLGVFQLTIPCLLLVRLTRELASPEIALLGLLEVIFGVFWAWVGAGEVPARSALGGGGLVVGALLANELLSLRERRGLAGG